MNSGTLINFLGWPALTFSWLEANRLFFNAIVDAINQHDEQIKQQVLENVKEYESEDESEDENKDENKDESEVVRV